MGKELQALLRDVCPNTGRSMVWVPPPAWSTDHGKYRHQVTLCNKFHNKRHINFAVHFFCVFHRSSNKLLKLFCPAQNRGFFVNSARCFYVFKITNNRLFWACLITEDTASATTSASGSTQRILFFPGGAGSCSAVGSCGSLGFVLSDLQQERWQQNSVTPLFDHFSARMLWGKMLSVSLISNGMPIEESTFTHTQANRDRETERERDLSMKKWWWRSGKLFWKSVMWWVRAVTPRCSRKGLGGGGHTQYSTSPVLLRPLSVSIRSTSSWPAEDLIGGNVWQQKPTWCMNIVFFLFCVNQFFSSLLLLSVSKEFRPLFQPQRNKQIGYLVLCDVHFWGNSSCNWQRLQSSTWWSRLQNTSTWSNWQSTGWTWHFDRRRSRLAWRWNGFFSCQCHPIWWKRVFEEKKK